MEQLRCSRLLQNKLKKINMKKFTFKLLFVCVCFLSPTILSAQSKSVSEFYLDIISRIKLEFIEDSGGRISVAPMESKGENGCNIKYYKPIVKNGKWQNVVLKFKPLQSGNTHFRFMMKNKKGSKNAIIAYLKDIKINGEIIDNGDFKHKYRHWGKSENKKFPIKIISKKKYRCLRINSKTDISRTFVFEAGKTYEFSFKIKAMGELEPYGDDKNVDLSEMFNVDITNKETPLISDSFAKMKSKMLVNDITFKLSNSGEKKAIIFRSSKFPQGRNPHKIFLKEPALEGQYIYILHTACSVGGNNETIGAITLLTDQGNKYYRDIRLGRDIGQFNEKCSYNNALPVDMGNGKYLYFSRIEMPNFENVVSMYFVGNGRVPWAIMAMTISEQKVYPFEITTPSPKEWTKADIPTETTKVVKGSALDFSQMLNTPIPAGATGRTIITERGTLAFEKTPDVDAKFRSYSFWSPLNFADLPKEERYEKIKDYCSRIREQGYNLVRIKLDKLKSVTS